MNNWLAPWRTNPRLQVAGWLVLALLWLYALLALADAVDATAAERKTAAAEWSRAESLRTEPGWDGLRRDSLRVLGEHRERCWREASEGRMQAGLQDWLRGQLAAAGMSSRDFSASVLPVASQQAAAGPDEPASDLRLVRVRTNFDFDPAALPRLLAALRREPRWQWVSRLSVDNGARRRVELELEALYVLDGSAPR